ncbi:MULTISPECIES: LuxR C-terminal-related transcriptional regulator [unclassified Pseudonocardia]|uniref:LuxR C-terminal-related transcriptional regulator n=1 Tax=unclassified Pseudonocardia TaxID=2619320 RepID=UPI000A8EDDA2|nr:MULTISPECIES: LuxR C-terminal-related transcriptional regulator [unclassified Pseudonocardia]
MGETTSRVAHMRRCDSGDRWPGQGRQMPRRQAGKVIDLLLAGRRLLDQTRLPHPEHVIDFGSARSVLRALWSEVMAALGASEGSPSRDLVTLLQAIKELDEQLLLDHLAHQDQALQRVRAALAHLGEARTSAALLDTAAATACGLGFDRSIVSRVADSLWIPERVHVAKDPAWAGEILELGRTHPQTLDGRLVESEMVRRRTSLLVDQVQERPGVNKPIADASMSRSYCAAPIVVHGVVAGFVHADCYYQQRNVDPLDRQLVTLYAQALGQALTRTMVLDEMDLVRADVERLSQRISDAREGNLGDGWWGHGDGEGVTAGTPPRGVEGYLRSVPDDPSLTRREVEVLRLMAGGDTNARIATRLVISEGTVKSHVKHILRKLGAANRAEAVSHWLRSGYDRAGHGPSRPTAPR